MATAPTTAIQTVVKKTPITEPWKPASVLSLAKEAENKLKSEGYVPRWCHIDQLPRHMLEGWEPVKGKVEDNAPALRLVDGTQLTNLVRKGNLILCKMPVETKKQRDAYYKNLASANLPGVVQEVEQTASDKDYKEAGGGVYGEIKIDKNIGG